MSEKRRKHCFEHFPNTKGFECIICGQPYSFLMNKLYKEHNETYRLLFGQTHKIIDSNLDRYYPCLTESEAIIKDIIE
jgi:hypothetical protein